VGYISKKGHIPKFDSERFQNPTLEVQSHMVTLGEDVDGP